MDANNAATLNRVGELIIKVASSLQAISAAMLPCLLVLTAFAIVQLLSLLQPIIVPVLFAFFLTFVLDPVVNLLTRFPNERCCLRFCLSRRNSQILVRKQELDEQLVPSRSGRRNSTTPSFSDKEGKQQDTKVAEIDPTERERMYSAPDEFEADLLPQPCACCLRTFRVPRCLAVFIAVLLLMGFFVLMGWVVAVSITTLNDNWASAYAPGFNQLVAWINDIAASLGYTLDDTSSFLMSKLELLATDFLSGFVGFVETFVLVIIFLCYFLSTPVRPKEGVWLQIDLQIRKYLHLKTGVSLLIGVLDGIILMCLGVDLAWIFAGFTFLANYVPNIGSSIATLLPMPLAILDSRINLTEKFLVLLAPFVLHNIVGNYLEPKLFGKHMELHPMIVLAALGFWSILWGVAGMVLSVPLVAIFRIVLLEIDHPYADKIVRLLEGRIFGKYDHVKDPLHEQEADGPQPPSVQDVGAKPKEN